MSIIKENKLQAGEGIKSIKVFDYNIVCEMALNGKINDSYTLVAILISKLYM